MKAKVGAIVQGDPTAGPGLKRAIHAVSTRAGINREKGERSMNQTVLRTVVAALLAVGILSAISCGGGGGGDSAPLAPPTLTNLAGARFNTVDTATAGGSCSAPVGTQDAWILHIVGQSGNTITFYDERAGSSNAVNGTMSGLNVTYSGSRYAVQGCSDMSASYNVNMNSAGTSFTGSGTVTCCSVPVNISGTKI
jgi:hypothetical protein